MVPAVGLEFTEGLAVALLEPVLEEALPLLTLPEVLPAVGRLAVLPLIDPPAVVRPPTLAPF